MDTSEEIYLTGVPQTTLASLWYRASEAMKEEGNIIDPVAVEVLSSMNYDFQTIFGEPDITISSRSRYSDHIIGDFFQKYPEANAVILGEGLETQFWRVDNGKGNWYSVDLPETIDVRRRYFPSHERNILISCSALDPAWSCDIQTDKPVFISTSGLLMYFKRDQVLWLLRHLANTFQKAELFMDIVPPHVSWATRFGVSISRNFLLPHMPFGLRLCKAREFFEQVDRVKVTSVVSIAEADPVSHEKLGALATSKFCRDHLLQGYVHARIG